MRLKLQFDGGCEPNPGRGTWAWVVYETIGGELGDRIASGSGVLKEATNNIAEHKALLMGLKWLVCLETKPDQLAIEGDSKLVINQITGEWGAHNPALKELRDRSVALLERLGCSWSATWIPRDQNTECDALGRGK